MYTHDKPTLPIACEVARVELGLQMRDRRKRVAAGREATPLGVPLSASAGVDATVKLDAAGAVPAREACARVHGEAGMSVRDRRRKANLGRRSGRGRRVVGGNRTVALEAYHECHNRGRSSGRRGQADEARHVVDDLGAIAQVEVGEVLGREQFLGVLRLVGVIVERRWKVVVGVRCIESIVLWGDERRARATESDGP